MNQNSRAGPINRMNQNSRGNTKHLAQQMILGQEINSTHQQHSRAGPGAQQNIHIIRDA